MNDAASLLIVGWPPNILDDQPFSGPMTLMSASACADDLVVLVCVSKPSISLSFAAAAEMLNTGLLVVGVPAVVPQCHENVTWLGPVEYCVVYAKPVFTAVTGYSLAEVLGRDAGMLAGSGADTAETAALQGGETYRGEI